MSKLGQEKKLLRRKEALDSLKPSMKREGKRKNFGRSDKLGKMQRNFTDTLSAKGKAGFNYFPTNQITGEHGDMFIG